MLPEEDTHIEIHSANCEIALAAKCLPPSPDLVEMPDGT